MKAEKNTPFDKLKAVIARACCIFTPVTLLLYSIGALLGNSEKSFIPTVSTVYIIFIIALAASLSMLLYKNPKMSFAAAHTLNFFLFAFFYYFIVVVMRKSASDGGYTIVAMVLYVLVYLLVTLCVLGVKGVKKKKINDMKDYESKF